MQVVADDVIEALVDVPNRDLVEAVGHRLNVPEHGKGRLELVFNNGEWIDGYEHGRLQVSPAGCICRKGGWNPRCEVHPPSAERLGSTST